ncbi:DUF971 domain-containing protein [Roseibium salinum]|uniref:DUF971 domain-containing protein n=1 Tax=Roseibium salinum TaxID=1604349 RepID=A0ABT3QVJ1_9HYPH|nr:DUF971 domain-containing protein [Roseibium sp. DSM 29163]MCX2720944.1 DUF971 domain-containing protein [Roseibium sp. DSM 29163]
MIAEHDAPPLATGKDLTDGEAPDEVRVGRKGKTLSLHWPDGNVSTFAAPFLRDNSQSARSKKQRLSGLAVPAAPDLTITAVRPIGSYAVNIVFSDGYDRGIFPWVYLRELAGEAAVRPQGRALGPEDFLKGN